VGRVEHLNTAESDIVRMVAERALPLLRDILVRIPVVLYDSRGNEIYCGRQEMVGDTVKVRTYENRTDTE